MLKTLVAKEISKLTIYMSTRTCISCYAMFVFEKSYSILSYSLETVFIIHPGLRLFVIRYGRRRRPVIVSVSIVQMRYVSPARQDLKYSCTNLCVHRTLGSIGLKEEAAKRILNQLMLELKVM
jgi:hypothetical protein